MLPSTQRFVRVHSPSILIPVRSTSPTTNDLFDSGAGAPSAETRAPSSANCVGDQNRITPSIRALTKSTDAPLPALDPATVRLKSNALPWILRPLAMRAPRRQPQ